MTDYKTVINEKIRKLQTLRDLADDPEMVEMMRAIGNAEKKPNGISKDEKTQDVSNGLPRHAGFTLTGEARTPRGLQKKLVLEILRSSIEPVTTDWIAEQMKKRGFAFKAAYPAIAVNEALRALSDDGVAKVARTEGVRNYWQYKTPITGEVHVS